MLAGAGRFPRRWGNAGNVGAWRALGTWCKASHLRRILGEWCWGRTGGASVFVAVDPGADGVGGQMIGALRRPSGRRASFRKNPQ